MILDIGLQISDIVFFTIKIVKKTGRLLIYIKNQRDSDLSAFRGRVGA
jgi:hypothetical protein